MGENCADCGLPAELKCSGCKLVAYCSKEHQKNHWKVHKTLCRPFTVEETKELGKCLVASRNLEVGDLVLCENPIVYGPRPSMVEEGPVPCPGCCRLIVSESSPRCENCSFPVCDPRCPGLEEVEAHGHECMILGLRDIQAINGLHDFYRQDVLLALRCLLLQKRNPKKYQQLMELESHLERRGKGTDVFNEVQDRTVNYLEDHFFRPLKIMERKTGKMILPDVSPETIHKICGIIDVNSMEINQGAEVSALYATACLLEHNCMPNVALVFEGHQVKIRACRKISKGEHLSTMYTHALWGTQARREHLKETKYFSCRCSRCSDPTEHGTYLSALICVSEGCGGVQLPVDPLDDGTEWKCSKCDVAINNSDVAYLVNSIGEEVDNVQISTPTVRELEGLLTKMATFVHPNHYHCYAVKHSLIQLYGYQQGYMPNQMSDDAISRKAAMCRELLEITRRIDPGNARLPLYTSVILHELHLANMVLVKRKWDVGIKGKVKSIVQLLRECKKCLQEAKEVLMYEKFSPAGEKLNKLIGTSSKEFIRFIELNKIEL